MKRVLLISFLAAACLQASAQSIAKMEVLTDQTRVMSTSLCRYAKAKGLFGKRQRVGMSHIAYPDGDHAFAIPIPLSTDHYVHLPAGKRAFISQANGNVVTLVNIHNLSREDNSHLIGNRYTLLPAYAVSDAQMRTLAESEVTAIRLETDRPGNDYVIKREDYPSEWLFNKYLQQCQNVLLWKLAELSKP